MGISYSDGTYYEDRFEEAADSPRQVMSDVSPDPIEAGQQYASARREVFPQM